MKIGDEGDLPHNHWAVQFVRSNKLIIAAAGFALYGGIADDVTALSLAAMMAFFWALD